MSSLAAQRVDCFSVFSVAEPSALLRILEAVSLLGVLPMSRTKAWLDTFAAIEVQRPERIVPGHGPPMSNKDYLVDIRRLLTSMDEQTRALIAAGTPRAEALGKIDVAWFRAKYVTNKMREGSFLRWFLRPIVENAYNAAEKKQ